MEFIKKLRLYIKIIFFILLISVSTVSISKNVFADDIEKFASRLFNHYEYDDKITNYLKSFFSFGVMMLKNLLKVQLTIQNPISKNKIHL